MVVKLEVTALEWSPNIYSDQSTSQWLPKNGLVLTAMVTDVTSGGNKH